MFLDKGNILFHLNELYKSHTVQSVSLYTHPGMGKSRLLQEFSTDKRVIYFKASPVSFDENFAQFKNLCERLLGQEFQNAKKFREVWKRLTEFSKAQPVVLILDDFPHWYLENKRFSTQLSSLIKNTDKNLPVFILLCKPASLYEKEISRDSHAFLLQPFNFFEMRRFYSGLPLMEQLLLYRITKGCPGYMEHFAETETLENTLSRLFFMDRGYFYRLVPSVIREYYGNSSVMNRILLSMKDGSKRLQEVCDETGLTPSSAGSLLNSLSQHNLVSRIVPVTEEPSSRRAIYLISDSIFAFWYRFVYPHLSDIEAGRGASVFQEFVKPCLDTYAQSAFEDVCRDFLTIQESRKEAPFHFKKIGKWWGQHPTKKRTESVSLAAAGENQILLGSCFWTDDWLDVDVLHDLQKHASLFPKDEQWYYLFSKSEFVMGFEEISGNHVRVFSLDKMCRISEEFLNSQQQDLGN